MSKFLIDFKSNQITLADARFYTTEEGKWVPSVTTILDAYPKDYGYFKWLKEVGEEADTIRDEAGRRGSAVHDLTERYDNGEEISLLNTEGHLSFKLNEWSMFERYVDFSTQHHPETLMVEQNIVSDKLGFAGTLDRIITLNGRKILVDIKTSNAIYPTYWLQLAAYRQLLWEEMGQTVDEVAILWLNAKTRTIGKNGAIQGIGWQLVTKESSTSDYDLFNHTLALWRAQNKDVTPRRLSYQMKYKR
jgi:hypothetical protein